MTRDDIPADELRELKLDYLSTTRETVRLMKQHAEALSSRKRFKQAFPILLYLSHQLKGSGGSIGFPRISELAQQISEVLNGYLEDEGRPQPGDLSRSVADLASQLESYVGEAEKETASS